MNEISIYEPFSRFFRELDRTAAFPVDVEEDKEKYRIHADIPGAERDDINISVENNTLFIGAKFQKSGGNTVHRERISGEFKRVIQLPRRVDSEGIEASVKNGVLTVVVPKSKAEVGRKIEIR